MTDRETERCGRCSVTAVVDATGEDGRTRDVFGDERIELQDDELRRASPHVVVAARCKRWIDDLGRRLVYGSRGT